MTEIPEEVMAQLARGLRRLGFRETDDGYIVEFSRVEKGRLIYDEYGPFVARATVDQKMDELLAGFLSSPVEEEAKKGTGK